MGACRDHVDAGWFERNLPRYTTYPTPARFHAGVEAEAFDAWLAGLVPGTRIDVRLHLPYCRELCWFCACRTQGLRHAGELDIYLDALAAEIRRTAALLPEGVHVGGLRLGGGTPTLLAPDAMRRLADTLRDALPVTEDAVFAVESDPRSLDPARLDALAASGVTEVTLGVTDFAPAVQRAIGRRQDAGATAATIAGLRERGIGRVGVDVVYGLPEQSQASLAAMLAQVLDMRPDRIALTGYMHVPWMAKRQRMIPEASLPDASTRFGLCRMAAGMIRDAGYLPRGAECFERGGAGSPRRAGATVGLGAAAISSFPQGHVQNEGQTARYLALIAGGGGAGTRGVVLRLEDRIRGEAIRRLLSDFRVDLAALRAEYGDLVQVLTPGIALASMRFGGLVLREGDVFAIPQDGVILARAVAHCFDVQGSAGLRPGA